MRSMLCGCPDALVATRPKGFFRHAPTLSVQQRDLTAGLPAPQAAAVRAAFQCEVTCPTVARAQLMPLSLDPVRFKGVEVPAAVLSLSCRYVAAYIVRVGAKLARIAPDPSRLETLRLLPASQLAQGTPHGAVELAFDDEAWLCDDPAPVSSPPVAPTPDPPAGARGRSPFFSRLVWRDTHLAFLLFAADSAVIRESRILQTRCLLRALLYAALLFADVFETRLRVARWWCKKCPMTA